MKRLISIISCIAVYGILLAQIIPNKQEKEPAVKLTVPEWSVVLSGIAKLPLEQSQGIYMKIISQVNQQLDTIPKKK